MSDSKTKYEEMEETKSNSGLGHFTQTTTQDDFEYEILDEYLVKNEETLMRDLLEEIRNWDYQWDSWRPDGIYPKPINADQFSKLLVEKYNISEKC